MHWLLCEVNLRFRNEEVRRLLDNWVRNADLDRKRKLSAKAYQDDTNWSRLEMISPIIDTLTVYMISAPTYTQQSDLLQSQVKVVKEQHQPLPFDRTLYNDFGRYNSLERPLSIRFESHLRHTQCHCHCHCYRTRMSHQIIFFTSLDFISVN